MQFAWEKTRGLLEVEVQSWRERKEQLPQCGEASPTVADTSEEDDKDEEGLVLTPRFQARLAADGKGAATPMGPLDNSLPRPR